MPLFSSRISQLRQRPQQDARGADPLGATATSLLKRYRPLETRAAGGFGSVEVCLDMRLQRRVAIKRMPLASRYSTAPAETRATALAEARTASLLQHPNIVSVIDFTYDDTYAYLVMEYVDGMSLEEFLAGVEGNSLTYDEAAAVADALVQALSFAHENGVLHLDIKPANVLIDRNGHVKLTDFGMAKLASAGGFGDARGGTVGYMPPEQLEGADVDERTDVFALAAVLYESLCATAPFRAGTPADSLKRIKRGVLYPSDLLPDIPEPTEGALLTALSPRAADRQASVAAFGDAFLARLGNPREGRRSLARIIARLTSDEADADGADGTSAQNQRVWELDPAEGYLGSRTPRARALVARAVAGVSTAVALWPVLGALGITGFPARPVVALALGAVGAIAPQLGSALFGVGFLMMIVSLTDLVPVLPVAAVTLALVAGWWYAWGRTSAAASAVLVACVAAGIASGGSALAAGPIAAVAGYLLPPVASAAAVGAGGILAHLATAALALEGSLPTTSALAALADAHVLAGIGGAAVCAAVTSLLLSRAWRRIQDGRGTGLLTVAEVAAGVMVVLLLCLANPMESSSSGAYPFALALGVGLASSIMVRVCIYALGYRKESDG